ncbi:MAG: hypothetical protein COB50_02510 [Thiotrichales bacterium]|nr:MAG: hypothetical protein COB50_02510 [Thiotrichales bacterium]
MLSIHQIKDVAAAVSYFAKECYYSKDLAPQDKAVWYGKGAAHLGILGDEVTIAKFQQLLSGRITPDVLLGKDIADGKKQHTPGYDFTFSAPKSVSMLAEIARDQRIFIAHERAVKVAMDYIEANAIKYRKTINGCTTTKKGDNLIIAQFMHHTSRGVDGYIDCNLHTHAVLMNAVLSQDDQWHALSGNKLYFHKMVAGMIYRAELARDLIELGYEIEQIRNDGLFEIKGISQKDIRVFSKRRMQIEKLILRDNLFEYKDAEIANLATRQAKQVIDFDVLYTQWIKQCKDNNIDLQHILHLAKQRYVDRVMQKGGKDVVMSKQERAEMALLATLYAVQCLNERDAIVNSCDLIKQALAYKVGTVSSKEIEVAMDEFRSKGELIYVGDSIKAGILFTTPKTLATEREVLRLAKQGRRQFDGIASQIAVMSFLEHVAEKRKLIDLPLLTNCQTKAIEFLTTNTHQVVGVQGDAGTGKTTMLGVFCEFAVKAGYEIVGIAPSSKACAVLKKTTGITTYTVHKWLAINQRQQIPNFFIKQKPKLLIIDEASMVDTLRMQQVLKITGRDKLRLIISGDRRQLSAVEAGDPFGAMQEDGLPCTKLTEVKRQEAQDLRYIVKKTIEYQFAAAIAAIGNKAAFSGSKSAIHEVDDITDRLRAMAKAYVDLPDEARQHAIVITGSNKQRMFLNAEIRQGLHLKGRILNDTASNLHLNILRDKNLYLADNKRSASYKLGDVVVFNKTYRKTKIAKHSYATVVKEGEDQVTLELPDGRMIIWQADKRRATAIKLYSHTGEDEKRELSVGDCIRITKNHVNNGIINGNTAIITAIDIPKRNIEVRLDIGKSINLDLDKLHNLHFDYAWTSTIYMTQGETANTVIAGLDGNNQYLSNQRSFLVAITRAQTDVQLFVDDIGKVQRLIQEHTGDKHNALNFLRSEQQAKCSRAYIRLADSKLQNRVHEEHSELARIGKMAKRFTNIPQKKRQKVALIINDFYQRQMLNALVRENLKQSGEIQKTELRVSTLQEKYVKQSSKYHELQPGMFIKPLSFRLTGLKKRCYYEVVAIRNIKGKQMVEVINNASKKSKSFLIDFDVITKHQKQYLEVYKQTSTQLATGDEITFTKDIKGKRIKQGQRARVQDITATTLTVEIISKQDRQHTERYFRKSRVVSLDLGKQATWHFTYAYAKKVTDALPKDCNSVIAHLDNKEKLLTRQQMIFTAIGKAKDKSCVYTHSKTYVGEILSEITGKTVSLKSARVSRLNNQVIEDLVLLKTSQQKCAKAWVSYFKEKEEKQKPDKGNSEVNLGLARLLAKASAELAHTVQQHIDTDKISTNAIQAFGFDVKKISKSAGQHKINEIIAKYKQEAGTQGELIKAQAAFIISNNLKIFGKELKSENILVADVKKLSYSYAGRMSQLRLTPEQRHYHHLVQSYFAYSRESRHLWARVFASIKQKHTVDRTSIAFAKHTSNLRNNTAYRIIANRAKYKTVLDTLSKKAVDLIAKSASRHIKHRRLVIDKTDAINSKHYKSMLQLEQQQRSGLTYIYPGARQLHKPAIKPVYYDHDTVLAKAMLEIDRVMSGIIGKDRNHKLSSSTSLVWGNKHGSVRLTRSGKYKNSIKDFESGASGRDIIHFYKQLTGKSYKEALQDIAQIVGISGSTHATVISPPKPPIKEQLRAEDKLEQEELRKTIRKQQLAKNIWDAAVPVTGTIAEQYLVKHRKLDCDLSKTTFKYNSLTPYGKTKKPALIIPIINETGELVAVQRIFLDKRTYNKDKSLPNAKMNLGKTSGAAAPIYLGGGTEVIIAEGAETAASLITIRPTANIYAACGLHNLGNLAYLARQHNCKKILIAADNDKAVSDHTWNITAKTARKIAKMGIKPVIYLPEIINNDKTDFNDVLKTHGKFAMENQFFAKYSLDMSKNITDETELVAIDLEDKSAGKKVVNDKQTLDNHPNAKKDQEISK